MPLTLIFLSLQATQATDARLIGRAGSLVDERLPREGADRAGASSTLDGGLSGDIDNNSGQ